MLTLALLRHAKSSWADARLDDFARPLARRGQEAAPLIGRYIAQSGLQPELVLCSAAVRTRETVDLVLKELQAPPKVLYKRCLYLATATAMLERIRQVGDQVGRLIIVGHNPGLQALGLSLVGQGRSDDITGLATRLPTGGMAVIAFGADSWADVRPASGRLEQFVTPKGLAAALEA
jgi:phosphohistidine phosphatase